MKKADVVIIITLLALAIGGLGVSKLLYNHKYANKYVEIYVKSKLYQKILIKDNSFKKTIVIKTDLGRNVIQINNGGVRMLEADCPNKICVKDGFKYKAGQSIICLPNKLDVEIIGEDKAEVDEVSF